MDIQMPKMNGFEAIDMLKKEGCPTPIIVALTARLMKQEREKMYESGVC